MTILEAAKKTGIKRSMLYYWQKRKSFQHFFDENGVKDDFVDKYLAYKKRWEKEKRTIGRTEAAKIVGVNYQKLVELEIACNVGKKFEYNQKIYFTEKEVKKMKKERDNEQDSI